MTTQRPHIAWSDSSARLALATVLAIFLIVATAIAGDYGLSWDEPDNATLGRQALQSYLDLQTPEEWVGNLEHKGPFFVMLAEILTRLISGLDPSLKEVGIRHFAYALSVPLALVSLYQTSRRFTGGFASLCVVLLFATQPLFFGHAFINPKDMPFMAFFLASMATGMNWVDQVLASREGRTTTRRAAMWVALGGIVLGLTTSVRSIAPFAGVLISILAVTRLKRQAIRPLLGYWIVAGLVTFATWPYLWAAPFPRFLESLGILVDFPWESLVLYRGLVYPAGELPWHFLPFVTLIQLTEPVVILSLLGAALAVIAIFRKKLSLELAVLLAAWILVPIGWAIVSGAIVYDNSRQFLFALPPVFILAGFAIEWVLNRLRLRWLQVALLGVALASGLIFILRLHPYQYVYYNSLVGGIPGAFRQYELDYWATAYREAMEHVNAVAPPNSVVAVRSPAHSAAAFARDDLITIDVNAERDESVESPSYLIISTRSNYDRSSDSQGRLVYEVKAGGAVLAVVRELSQPGGDE